MTRLAPFSTLAVLLLVGCGGGGNDRGSSSSGGNPNPGNDLGRQALVGSWTGTMAFGGDYTGENGPVSLTVAADGTVTGATQGSFQGQNGTIQGNVEPNGTMIVVYTYDTAIFTIAGTFQSAGADAISGQHGAQRAGNTFNTNRVDFALTRS